MNIRPVKRISISDEIAEQVKELIVSGALKPGDRLPTELELAEKFGASRSSVREALKALSYIGLITRTKEGTFISKEPSNFIGDPLINSFVLKKISLESLLEARKIIEVPLAGMAAERHNNEDILEMEKCIEEMKQDIENPSRFSQEGLDFHLAVASASQNLILYEFLYAIRNLQMMSNMEVVKSPEILRKTIKYHIKILEAIKTEDAEQAEKLMLEHILDVENELRKMELV